MLPLQVVKKKMYDNSDNIENVKKSKTKKKAAIAVTKRKKENSLCQAGGKDY